METHIHTKECVFKRIRIKPGTSLVVQWLGPHCDPNAGGLGLIPGGGTRSHTLQLRPGAAR